MATLWNLVLVVLLLALSAPQRCSGVDHGSMELRDVKHLSALQIVNNALKRTSENAKEGVRLHEKNNEALKDLQSLLELLLMVKEQKQNTESMTILLMALHREDGLSQENAELKNQLRIKDKMVRHLEELVSNHTNTEELLSNKVQVLEKRILEHQEKEEQLEETVVELNNTVAAQKKCADSPLENQPHKQEIIRLVQQFNNTKDWGSLRRGLESVLDNSSEAYIQLQRMDYSRSPPMYHVGHNSYTQLASLLLDAGLPIDTVDAGGYSLLHGATADRQLQMMKLLLDRGASVDVRDENASTPLMYAATAGYLEVAQYLVSAGADTTVTNKWTLTALDYALSSGHTAVIRYLEQLPH